MASSAKEKEDFVVLNSHVGGGPHGLGDPNDQSMRRVEKEIMVPQKMKERAKKEKCAGPVKDFGVCAKETGLMVAFKCRKEAKQLEQCLSAAYKDQAFIDDCTAEYLRERSEYRRTGIPKKLRKKESVMF